MLTAEKVDNIAFARDEIDAYEIKVQNIETDWQREEREQEFKQALLEGRYTVEQRRFSLNSFKFFLWIK